MAKKIWKDHEGNVVPTAYVPTIEKKKDRLAQRIYKRAVDLSERLTKFGEESISACDELYMEMLSSHNVTLRKNSRGGYSITSFDKEIKIEFSIQVLIEFTDLLGVAQEKINEYLAERTGGVDHDIQQLVNVAFKKTKGQLDVKSVFILFPLTIKHKKWVEAMDILKKAITRNSGKRYMRVWVKDPEGKYKSVNLNFSSI